MPCGEVVVVGEKEKKNLGKEMGGRKNNAAGGFKQRKNEKRKLMGLLI